MTRRLLIVNADDFGYTRDVNEGIIEAHLHGIVTAATLMACGDAFDDAVELALRNPALDVGCHLTLIGGTSVLPSRAALPGSPAELARLVCARQIDVEAELRAQVRRLIEAGIQPTHLDTHKHSHMLPQVAAAVAVIAREFSIRWVRRPLGFPLVGPLVARIYRDAGCRMTDNFAGYKQTGKLDATSMVSLIESLPDGLTELMCHPGRLRDELRGARTRLKASRQNELEALTSPEVRAAVQRCGVRLGAYRSMD